MLTRNNRLVIPTPIISLWQPWAQWVILGIKTIETRTHRRLQSLVGQRIGIHASMKWDNSALGLARPYLNETQIAYTLAMPRTGGMLLGTVSALKHRPLTPEDAPGALIETESVQRFGLFLSNPIGWDKPLPMKGHQGIWYVDLGKDSDANRT